MLQSIFSSTEQPISNNGQREPVNNNNQQEPIQNPPKNDGQGSARPTPIRLISQRTYGCVFRPGINCDGSPGEPDYITKMQTDEETVKNEINIGKIIQTIPNFEENFAPILETCPIDIKTVNQWTDDIEDCKAFSRTTTTIETNKIKYVGTNTLWTYLMVELKENPRKFVELMLETHMTLLDSLQKLAQVGIVHNDLKENNIICRDEDGRPIIIDFGLSLEAAYLKLPSSLTETSRIHEYFFKYDPIYSIWAIDIALLNYMLDTLNNEWLTSIVTKSHVDDLLLHAPTGDRKIVSQYLSKFINTTWRTLLVQLRKDNDDDWIELIYLKHGYQWRTEPITETHVINVINNYIRNLPVMNADVLSGEFYNPELQAFKDKLITYFSKFYGQEWQVLFDELVQYSNSWDNYALSLIYLHLLEAADLDDDTDNNNNNKIPMYQEILKANILCCPNERPTAKETQTRLINALQTVTKPVSEQLKKNIQTIPHDEVIQTIKKLQQHYSRSSFTS
jgi:serine/threonine protein kinase